MTGHPLQVFNAQKQLSVKWRVWKRMTRAAKRRWRQEKCWKTPRFYFYLFISHPRQNGRCILYICTSYTSYKEGNLKQTKKLVKLKEKESIVHKMNIYKLIEMWCDCCWPSCGPEKGLYRHCLVACHDSPLCTVKTKFFNMITEYIIYHWRRKKNQKCLNPVNNEHR